MKHNVVFKFIAVLLCAASLLGAVACGFSVVVLRHLREKIEINPSEPRYLKVVWGQGYKMEGETK